MSGAARRSISTSAGRPTLPNKILLPEDNANHLLDFRRRLLNLLQSAIFSDTTTITAAGTTALQFLPSVLLCDATAGNQTIALPRVGDFTTGTYFIKKVDSSANTVTIDPDSTDVIDDAATFVLSVQYDSIFFVSNGTKWHILARGAVANSLVEKIEIAKAGALVGTRKRVNLIEGTNVTMTVADNAGSDRVDVTINSTAAGSTPSMARTFAFMGA